jgi:hypothetical protein
MLFPFCIVGAERNILNAAPTSRRPLSLSKHSHHLIKNASVGWYGDTELLEILRVVLSVLSEALLMVSWKRWTAYPTDLALSRRPLSPKEGSACLQDCVICFVARPGAC